MLFRSAHRVQDSELDSDMFVAQKCPGSVPAVPESRVLFNKRIDTITSLLWNHSSFPKQLECFPPSFLRAALLRKPCLLSKPTEAEVAVKSEPVVSHSCRADPHAR